MKPIATLVAIPVRMLTALALTGLALTGLLLVGPSATPAYASPVRAAPLQSPFQLDPDGTAGPLRLDLTQLTPRVVTTGGPRVLTLAGTLTNTGDQPIGDLVIRVQRGDPLGTEGAVRDALDGDASTDAVTPQFTGLPGELAPRGQMPIRLTVPLRGAPGTSLALGSTGVHELLVNVNGVPRDGQRARLAAVRMLLPVLSLPPSPDAAGSVPPPPAGPAIPFSLLFPITDTPRLVATVPGEPTLLTDDDLAASMAPGGRLGSLVSALTTNAPPGSSVRQATCLAIDPDLVKTASLMRAGYEVERPGGGGPVPGSGAEVAGQWLDSLTAVAKGGCVIALPYADADLVALTRGGLGELATTTIQEGRQVLSDILHTTVVPGVTWPVGGVADDPALDRIGEADGRSLVLSADGVDQGRVQRHSGVVPIAGGNLPQFAVLTDPLLTRAATGPSSFTGPDPGRGGAVVSTTPAGVVGPLSTQDLIGALTFRTEEAPDGAAAPGPLVLAPPHQWAVEGAGADALLATVDQLLQAHRIVPRALDGVLAAGPPAGTAPLAPAYPLRAGGSEIPGSAVDIVGETARDIEDLSSAAVPRSGVGVSPDDAFDPLRLGLARPVSAAWRGRPAAATAAATAGAGRVAELRASVRVLEPPSPYSLGTSDAPILITVANGLPVTVEVHVEILPSAGLRVAPIPPQQVPPLGRRQVRVSAEVTRSGQFIVQAAVRTPGGELLGPPSRLRVRSTAYGTITVWLTASAGGLLVVLAVRRVLRRVRGEPGRTPGRGRPAPETDGRPEPPRPRPDRPGPAHPGPPGPGRVPPAKTGDPFPDPLAVTERLPTSQPRPDGPPRPPGRGPQPPRVPSP
ncbi:DUF6049 family protein [Pseudonocardia xinjiangensis]|uniref:DUF6049 family protein n=1 Tax=Pseudonocardia xinjiangensis TaxID=75289 RepID=UPI003D8C9EE6